MVLRDLHCREACRYGLLHTAQCNLCTFAFGVYLLVFYFIFFFNLSFGDGGGRGWQAVGAEDMVLCGGRVKESPPFH